MDEAEDRKKKGGKGSLSQTHVIFHKEEEVT